LERNLSSGGKDREIKGGAAEGTENHHEKTPLHTKKRKKVDISDFGVKKKKVRRRKRSVSWGNG